jgi:uncharacterized membrane protein
MLLGKFILVDCFMLVVCAVLVFLISLIPPTTDVLGKIADFPVTPILAPFVPSILDLVSIFEACLCCVLVVRRN